MRTNPVHTNPEVATIVGRDTELSLLRQGLSNTISDPSSVYRRFILLQGHSGVGKSAIANAAISIAKTLDYQVCQVACEPFHEGMSFFPIRELVRQLVRGNALRDAVAELFGEASSQAVMASVSESVTADPVSRREALVATFSNIVYGRFRSDTTRPLLMFIDDLEHLDAGSADTLISMVARLSEGPVILLGAYRTDLVSHSGHPLRTVIRSARRQNGLIMPIQLDAFPAVDLPALTSTILGGKCNLLPAFYDKLYHETEGNPLFIKEVLNSLQMATPSGELPPLHYRDNAWNFSGSLELWHIPASIEDVIATRLDMLDEGHRNELEFAAVIGRRFAFEVLCSLMTSGEDELLRHLEHLVSFDIIRELNQSDDSFEFSHGKIRDVLYTSFSGLRRRRIHHQVATVLQGLQGTTNEDWDALIGEHLFQAANQRDAFPFLLRAARNARRTGSTREAVGLFRKSYVASERAVMSESDTRQSVLLELAAALISASQTDEAGALLEQLTRADTQSNIRGWALNYLGDTLLFEGDVDQALDTYRECKDLAERLGDPELLCEVLCDLAELHGRQYERLAGVNLDEAGTHRSNHERCNIEAFHLLDRVRDNSRRARVLRNRAKSLRVEGRLMEALEFYEQSIAAVDSRVAGHRFQIPYAKTLRLVGRNAEALAVAERVLTWASQVGSTRSSAIACQYRGLFLMMAAESAEDLLEARHALQTAVQQHHLTGDAQGQHETEMVLGEVSLRLGDQSDAVDHFKRSVGRQTNDPARLFEIVAQELDANGEVDRAKFIREKDVDRQS